MLLGHLKGIGQLVDGCSFGFLLVAMAAVGGDGHGQAPGLSAKRQNAVAVEQVRGSAPGRIIGVGSASITLSSGTDSSRAQSGVWQLQGIRASS
jgi:hypothetical protein